MKTCRICHRSEPIARFYANSRRTECKECNPERQIRRTIKREREAPRPVFSFMDHWIST